MTQRQGTAASYTDYYMQNSANAIEYKTERDPASATIARDERTKDLDQLAGSTFANISNLAKSNSFIEMYGGGTGGTPAGFDGLMQRGGRHYLAGLGRFTSRMGNNPYQPSSLSSGPSVLGTSGLNYHGPGIPEFMDLRCKKCTCDFLNPGGGWGCFTPEEMEIYKPVLCMAALFDCNTCKERCPGMLPLPGQSSESGSTWSLSGGIFPINGGSRLNIFKIKPGHEDIGGAEPHEPPPPDTLNEGCWQYAAETCGLLDALEALDQVADRLRHMRQASCPWKCSPFLYALPPPENLILYSACVAHCMLVPQFYRWGEIIAALKQKIWEIFSPCLCLRYADCAYSDDSQQYDRFTQCCLNSSIAYGEDAARDHINRCVQESSAPLPDPHKPPPWWWWW
jgi:hypothetical protein